VYFPLVSEAVSIPFRGRGLGKPSVEGGTATVLRSFHPLSGKRFRKEFSQEALHRAGFRGQIDTPPKKVTNPAKNWAKHIPQTLAL
jgi:hypothetical protein